MVDPAVDASALAEDMMNSIAIILQEGVVEDVFKESCFSEFSHAC